MIFNSKYNIGDSVTVIYKTDVKRPPVACAACDGTGDCLLRGERFTCPKCNGRKTTQATGRGWVIAERGIVGNIRCHTVTLHDEEEGARDSCIYEYMLSDTGSGSLYQESRLWPRDEAQAECDRRNAEDA